MRRDRTEGVEDYQEGDGQDHVAQRPQGVPKRLFLRCPESGGDQDEGWVVCALE
jgi:hypothetical protein